MVFLFCCLCLHVPPAAQPPAPSDAGTEVHISSYDGGGTPCEKACGNMRSIGCPEGTASENRFSCETVCEHATRDLLLELHLDCLASATSKDAARACRSVDCE